MFKKFFKLVTPKRLSIALIFIIIVYTGSIGLKQKITIDDNKPFGGGFELIDHNGNRITDDFLKGSFTLVYFGFTYCTDICPITLDIIVEAIDSIPNKSKEKIKVLFVTLDPLRDDSETLSSYLLNYQPFVTGATGSPKEVKDAADKFLVIYEKIDLGNNDYSIGHSGYIYLMDKNGNYIDHFNYDISIKELYKKLNSII